VDAEVTQSTAEETYYSNPGHLSNLGPLLILQYRIQAKLFPILSLDSHIALKSKIFFSYMSQV